MLIRAYANDHLSLKNNYNTRNKNRGFNEVQGGRNEKFVQEHDSS